MITRTKKLIRNLMIGSLILTMMLPSVVISKETSRSQYQNDINIKETTESSDNIKLEKIDDMNKYTEDLINQADLILYEQDKLNYKYEEIPLDDSLKNLILQESENYGIDPDVMFGLYYVESRFNPSASNGSSSARGLGQILNTTAKWLYKQVYGSSNYTHDIAYDAEANIKMSTYYIYYLYQKSGSIDRALINYNGGELGRYYYTKVMSYANSLKEREENFVVNK